MANAILNFHFDYLKPSLIKHNIEQGCTDIVFAKEIWILSRLDLSSLLLISISSRARTQVKPELRPRCSLIKLKRDKTLMELAKMFTCQTEVGQDSGGACQDVHLSN